MPPPRVDPLNTRGTVAPTPSSALSAAPLAASSSASSMVTVSRTSTSSSVYWRGLRFCAASTPTIRPARRTGTAIIEANGSSPVSAR